MLNFEILGEMEPRLQTHTVEQAAPVPKPIQNENIAPKSETVKNPNLTAKNFFNKEQSESNPMSGKLNTTASTNQPGMFNNFKIFDITTLNPYQNKLLSNSIKNSLKLVLILLKNFSRWSIKARVTNKSGIRTYSNAKGEGKLFSIELIDKSGEIKCTGFNEQCEKFYDLLQIDNVK